MSTPSDGYVLTFGETMALLRPEVLGPLSAAHTMSLGIGGAESNVAIGLSRLGLPVTWIGRVGADSLGQLVTREIRAEGVDTWAIADAAAPTGMMVKERRTATSTRVTYYRSGSAGSRLAAADIPDDLVGGARLLHLTGITPALSATALEATVHAMGIARANDVPVSFDLNYRKGLWGADEATAVYRELLPLTDVAFAGEDEAEMVVGAHGSPQGLAERVAQLGPSQAIIKLGARGAVASIDGASHERRGLPITPIDTVGAGDAFAAGYLAELLVDAPPARRLETACRLGAFACLALGDWEGLPRRDELGLLEEQEHVAR